MEEIENLKQQVINLLEKDNDCRNNDNLLVLKLLKKMGFNIKYDPDDIKEMPSFESITRCRRFIQNEEGRFLPNQNVQELRTVKEEELKWYFKPRNKRKRNPEDIF